MFHPSFDRELNKLETNVYVTFKKNKIKAKTKFDKRKYIFATFEMLGRGGVWWLRLRGCHVIHNSHKNNFTHYWIGNWTSYKSIYNFLINDQFKTSKKANKRVHTHLFWAVYRFELGTLSIRRQQNTKRATTQNSRSVLVIASPKTEWTM